MDPGVLHEWVEKVRRHSPSLSVGIDLHSVTITTSDRKFIRLMVVESTVPGLENITDAARVVGTMVQRVVDKIAAEELKRRGGAPAAPSSSKLKGVYSGDHFDPF